jgi:hypothetical protein
LIKQDYVPPTVHVDAMKPVHRDDPKDCIAQSIAIG